MIPAVWGPQFWYCIFYIASTYPNKPDNDYIRNIQNYLISLRYLLPCSDCKNSYNRYSKENDSDIDNIENYKSRDNFLKMIYNLRNKVNNKVGYDYKISFKYFKSKIDHMTCYNKDIDVDITRLREVPFIPDKYLDKVLQYVHNNNKYIKNYNSNTTKKILRYSNTFLCKPIWNKNNKLFLVWYTRNKECRKIIDKINKNMNNNNYNFIKSFDIDKKLHLKLFYLGCSIIPKDDLAKIFY